MPATPADLPADDYILGRTSEEYQRLRRQARLWEATTARVLDQVGIQPAMRCLDVGCGQARCCGCWPSGSAQPGR